MSMIQNSGKFSAFKGAIDLRINDESYQFHDTVESLIDGYDISRFLSMIVDRIRLSSGTIYEALQAADISQAAFCDEVNCEKTHFNKVLRFVEGSNKEKMPRTIPYQAIENVCNRLDINVSKLFLGIDPEIVLPKKYTFALKKMSELSDRKQDILLGKLREISREYLFAPNIMTIKDPSALTVMDFRYVIGRRCRMYTDERNMPPAYVISNGSVRRRETNLFEALNREQPVFLGRIAILMAICYTSDLPMEYFLVRDLSQEHIVKRTPFFTDNPPTPQMLETLRLFCSTEQNEPLNNTLVAAVIANT